MKRHKQVGTIFLILFLIIISIFIIFNYLSSKVYSSTSSSLIGVKVSPSVYFQLKTLSMQGYNITNTTLLKAVYPTYYTLSLDYQGKPVVIFVGAEWCPFCGAEMWALLIALDRFGNISGLEYMLSSSTDVYPNTPTFTLANVTYESKYISLLAYEYQNRNHQTLQALPQNVYQLWQEYGHGSIPFIYVAGLYYQVGSTVSPSILSGKNWTYAFSQLNNLSSPFAQQVYSTANILTAEFCIADNNQPYNVCGLHEIQILEHELISKISGNSSLVPQVYASHDTFNPTTDNEMMITTISPNTLGLYSKKFI